MIAGRSGSRQRRRAHSGRHLHQLSGQLLRWLLHRSRKVPDGLCDRDQDSAVALRGNSFLGNSGPAFGGGCYVRFAYTSWRAWGWAAVSFVCVRVVVGCAVFVA